MTARLLALCLFCLPSVAQGQAPPDPVALAQGAKEATGRAAFVAFVEGTATPQERSKAIRALPRAKDQALVEKLKAWTANASVFVQVEATIKLYQWGDSAFAYPLLVALRNQGVALRRAFQLNQEGEPPKLDAAAERFFREGLASSSAYVRVDSAVGLIHVGKPAGALDVIKDVLLNDPKYTTRLAAVNYLTPIKTSKGVRELLKLAAKDIDEHVSARAKAVLATLED